MLKALRLNAVLAFALLAPSITLAQDSQQRTKWNRPFAPFRIIGDVYYVGTEGLSAFLITGPKGHVLIDGALPESARLIADNIRRLGFKLRDVKYLLIDHTHYDHAGGLAELKRRSGAVLVASAGEVPDLLAGKTVGRPDLSGFPAVKVDRVIGDNERIVVGPVVLRAILSPGHTRGSVSWVTDTAGKRVLFATSLTVAGQKLVGDPHYPTAGADFVRTLKRLRTVKADVFLNFHPDMFDMEAKRARQIAGDANAFVDPGELTKQLYKAERQFKPELAQEQAAARH